MLVALIAMDRPGGQEVRKANRSAHLAYLKASEAVRQAGPILDSDGEMCGSLIILEVSDMDEAEDWVRGDPYGEAALFDSVELRAWNRVIEQ